MKELTWQQRLLRFCVCLLLAVMLWFMPMLGLIDVPEELLKGWHIFSVFIAVIARFILRPYPIGAMVLFGLVALMATGVITTKEALAGYGDTTVWLVVAAFLIAGGVIRTGFGRRLALMLVSRLAKSPLGLGYSFCGAELLLGPVVPSNTARGGGILAPIVRSLAEALESHPTRHPERAGTYLVLVGAQANLITAAMFLTGMAANPLVSKAAESVFGITFDWGIWALGALVPGLVGLALLPIFIYLLAKPTLTDTSEAQAVARWELQEMGRFRGGERIMAGVFTVLLLLWGTKSFHGMHTTLVAWIGVSILLMTNTEKWQDIVENDKAWDTLIWLGGLLTMANSLKDYGFIDWFAQSVGVWVAGISGITVVLVLGLVYFYSMYSFSMLTAHIAAMVAAFFAVALGAGAPAMLTVAIFAYFSNLCGCTTNYSTGPVIIYFGLGYVSPQKWFANGFLVSLYHLAIWFGVGLIWWKILGWW